ncbi:MAG: hypothetical protein Q8R88_07165 [Desulfoprunum sp.]|nr:hypothetical protein [Desulfoprunum sp.]
MPETTPEKQQATPQPPMIQAMVWYREEDWDTLKTLFTDTQLLPKTYADWLIRAEEMKTRVQADGDIVIKVYIDPETFPAWCEQKGLKMDAEARSQLAIEVAQAQSFSL